MIDTPRRYHFTDADATLLRECVRVASAEMDALLQQTHRRHPQAALCDSLRRWRERASDLAARLEAR